jgi:hypothetical protein
MINQGDLADIFEAFTAETDVPIMRAIKVIDAPSIEIIDGMPTP